MKPGDKILILPSYSLTKLKLEALKGQPGIIVAINGSFNNIKGCWVQLPGKYLGEREWYIPYNSVGI